MSVQVPHPVLKWAGGKRQLIPQLAKFVPAQYNIYIEPFVGGGALFFWLKPKKAILIDNNPELMNVYGVIKEDVDDLISALGAHLNEEEYYYRVRNVDRDQATFASWSAVDRAARTIYMNRVCYNGLYRVNKKGEFNVPFGSYTDPVICDEENLLAVHEVLQNVTLVTGSFERCLEFAMKDDFVYMDPPYVPLSGTAYFTSYTRDCFDAAQQEALYGVFVELDRRGCHLLLSNSYCEPILDLYKDYRIETIMANRAINSDATKRGKIKEVLVLNS
jgi:DNA adenine methylase